MKYKKILIVDDSGTSRMIIKKCFFIAGYENAEFIEAKDGLEALNVLKFHNIDLIVTDFIMPKMNGIELIKNLRKKKDLSDIPVLIISSLGDDAVLEELNDLSVLSIISKPFSSAKIVEVLGSGDYKLDKREIGRVFISSVIDTFAEMAFVNVISEKKSGIDIKYSNILGIDFSEPLGGNLLFYMPKECKKELVENIYGKDWKSLQDEEIDDCLLEILNVLAGDFLKNLFGKEQKIIMSIPKIFFDDSFLPEMDHGIEFIFNADGVKFKAQVCFKE